MARTRKSDNKRDESASPQVSLEDFIRTRDLVSTLVKIMLVAKVEDCQQLPLLWQQKKRIPHPSILHYYITKSPDICIVTQICLKS